MNIVKEKEYWKNFYDNNNNIVIKCSDFCNFIIKYLNDSKIIINNVLDCGCGNGRDSYELSKYYNVVGIDNSGFLPEEKNNCNFYNGNFININKDKYDLIYSRFTLHSIDDDSIFKFLNSIKLNQYLVIETRSDKGNTDNLYHGNSHYRNLTNLNNLILILTNLKFQIIYLEEKDNFAIYKNENPICIRLICKKYNYLN